VKETIEPHLVGDGYDSEPLWTPRDVAEYVGVPYKRVLDLPIPRIRLSSRRIRYRPQTVREYVQGLEKRYA